MPPVKPYTASPTLKRETPCPNLLHHTGEVHAQNGGQWLLGVLGGARADLGVRRIHAAGVDADQHLARSGLWPGQQGRGQCAVGAASTRACMLGAVEVDMAFSFVGLNSAASFHLSLLNEKPQD